MSVTEKPYDYPPAIIWNLINDIVEMRKGKVTHYDAESMTIETEMYGIKTGYVFRVVPAGPGVTVTVETGGEDGDEDGKRRAELMFATLENMLGPFM